MGTRNDMVNMINFIRTSGIKPHIGGVYPMADAATAFRDMIEGSRKGKLVLAAEGRRRGAQ